jgi:hypothetical protein
VPLIGFAAAAPLDGVEALAGWDGGAAGFVARPCGAGDLWCGSEGGGGEGTATFAGGGEGGAPEPPIPIDRRWAGRRPVPESRISAIAAPPATNAINGAAARRRNPQIERPVPRSLAATGLVSPFPHGPSPTLGS